jgi:hypothetical protein
MDNPAPTNVRLWLETAATALRTVDAAWTDDANTVASVAVSIDPDQRRYLGDPDRLRQLRQALHIVEGLLDEIADAEAS